MRFYFFFIVWIFSFGTFAQIEGTWSGDIELPTGNLPFVVHITQENGKLKATADSPQQGAFGIKLDSVHFENDVLYFDQNQMMMSYEGTLHKDKTITGSFKQSGFIFPLNFKNEAYVLNRPQHPEPPFDYHTEEVKFTNSKAKIKLAGTLSIPNGKGPFPALVLVTGSGPQDRDETVFGHKPFLVIADFLTKNGYAVLRYDDRGVNASEGDFETATTYDFADDAGAALDYLKTLKSIDSKKIGVLGHSEGGMVTQILAATRNDIEFIISLAGPGISIDQVMVSQKRTIESKMGVPESHLDLNDKIFAGIYAIMKKDISSEAIETEIRAFLNSDEAYKSISEKELRPIIDLAHDQWFLTFIKYNPNAYFPKIKTKVLAMNGEKDVQVLAKENLQGWKDGLTHNPNVTIKSYPGLNHSFQPATTGMPNEYATIETTIAPEVLEDILAWLNEYVNQ